ncbi:hypothetical protein B0T16DRAFT_403449 [Cercophora newfieldiana]|uniref:Uncharacterized protein n=1 Tax=Cercophora newfieldiana TaxID=92897 RepID=A0AA39YF79_9PEZI|nr:hypothetical protein B0T16DRAFT_403449 [Cercophora newfieldiana]
MNMQMHQDILQNGALFGLLYCCIAAADAFPVRLTSFFFCSAHGLAAVPRSTRSLPHNNHNQEGRSKFSHSQRMVCYGMAWHGALTGL